MKILVQVHLHGKSLSLKVAGRHKNKQLQKSIKTIASINWRRITETVGEKAIKHEQKYKH